MTTIGERIRNARKKANLTQVALAELLGIDQSAIAHWERNYKLPSRENVRQLSKHLTISSDSLLDGANLPSKTVNVRPLQHRYAPVDRREELEVFKRSRAKTQRESVPNWLNAATGPGCFLELSDDYYYIPKLSRSRGIHMAVIRGESMRETLSPGDTIVMRSFADRGLVMPPLRYGAPKGSMQEWRSKIRDKGIYALSINHEGVTIKRVLFQGQEPDWYVVVEADNRNEWEPRTIRLGDEVVFFAEILGLAQD